MQQFIGCDAHKRFSVFVAVDERGNATNPVRIEHHREHYTKFLDQLPLCLCGPDSFLGSKRRH
jgi:hypothetical protein